MLRSAIYTLRHKSRLVMPTRRPSHRKGLPLALSSSAQSIEARVKRLCPGGLADAPASSGASCAGTVPAVARAPQGGPGPLICPYLGGFPGMVSFVGRGMCSFDSNCRPRRDARRSFVTALGHQFSCRHEYFRARLTFLSPCPIHLGSGPASFPP